MLINCKHLNKEKTPINNRGLIKLLTEGSLISPTGELKEEVEVFLGGPFFKKLTPDKTDNRFPWTFSTFDEDRDEERIDPAGWKLDNYLKNPVVLWAHDSRIPAIGYAEGTGIHENTLSGEVIFNDKEVDPFGWGVGQRVASGAIRAGSVGFLIHKVEIQENGKESKLIFRNQELLEFSICNVPSNPFALNLNHQYETPIPDHTEPKELEKTFWTNLIRSV
ncbi:MAG: peptidase [Spirochaetales bacterium]|nr:peptidase [Spirochaetales bacterium]